MRKGLLTTLPSSTGVGIRGLMEKLLRMKRGESLAKRYRVKAWDPSLWVSRKPFGIGEQRPNNYLEIWKALWENKDQLPFAWRILQQGVCDGCSLGTAGMTDWTLRGVHLCNLRLRLLRLNTMPALNTKALEDLSGLRGKRSNELRAMGRLPYPMVRQRGQAGFRRISWDEALDLIASRIRAASPDRLGFYLTSRGMPNEAYYAAQKAVRAIGTNSIDNAARVCHSPSTFALKQGLGVASTTCSYSDLIGSNPGRLRRCQRGQQPAGNDEIPVLCPQGWDPGGDDKQLPRTWDGAVLGPLGSGERALWDEDDRPVFPGERRRRYPLSQWCPEVDDRARLGPPGIHRPAHRGFRRPAGGVARPTLGGAGTTERHVPAGDARVRPDGG